MSQDESLIKKIVLLIVQEGGKKLTDDQLAYHVIKALKCNLEEAQSIIERMNILGLPACKESNFFYDMQYFAVMRGYLSEEELAKLDKAHRRK